MMANDNLRAYESFFYFFAWSGGVAYSVYKLYLANAYFNDYEDLYADFAPGWSWLRRKQDISDQEWRVWIPLMIRLIPWVFVHHLISSILKTVSNQMVLCCWYTCVSVTFIYSYLGASGVLCILTQLSVTYFLTYKCEKIAGWFIHIAFLFLIHFIKTPEGIFQQWLKLRDEEHYILTLMMSWSQLRSISQNMDSTEFSDWNYSSHVFTNFVQKLAYCLYLPTLFLGPLILYHEFVEGLNQPSRLLDWPQLRSLIFRKLVRYIFWLYFTEFCLHFIYFNALQYHPEVVQNLNSWALYGFGYCMGQYFLNKYVVVYGISGTLCEMDGIEAPPQPKCIGRIHLYSDMWKHFDRGLYKFLVRYIYRPMQRQESSIGKLLASFLCFAFVFVWHGMLTSIFIWAFFNFIGLTVEGLAKYVARDTAYNKLNRFLSPQNIRRFNCVLASPLLAMSAISNFYFFAGEEIGHIFVWRALNELWNKSLLLLFFLYCCCQVSTDVKRWESRRPLEKRFHS